MNSGDILDLLEYVQLGDARTIGKADVEQWQKIIPPHITLTEAMEAVEMHRRESTNWLMPAHIIANVKKLNLERRREEARQLSLGYTRTEPSRVPWWFKKLYEAELNYTKQMRKENPRFRTEPVNGDYPVVPMYEGDELTVEQKLAKFGIKREEGDEAKAAVFAAAHLPHLPVPKLGSFIRDPEENHG
jgi:hypothetical protein